MLDFGPSWDRKWSAKHLGVNGTCRFIYCISEAGSCSVKVGITQNSGTRMATLQALNPRQLTLEWSAPGYGWHERAIHIAARDIRIRGEWFNDFNGIIRLMLSGQENTTPDLEAAIFSAGERLAGRPLPRSVFSFKGGRE